MIEKRKTTNKYTEDFKQSIVTLLENGRTYTDIEREYGVSYSSASKWKKQYSMVTTEDGEVLSMKEIKELQKKFAILEEENIILKKAAALFLTQSEKR